MSSEHDEVPKGRSHSATIAAILAHEAKQKHLPEKYWTCRWLKPFGWCFYNSGFAFWREDPFPAPVYACRPRANCGYDHIGRFEVWTECGKHGIAQEDGTVKWSDDDKEKSNEVHRTGELQRPVQRESVPEVQAPNEAPSKDEATASDYAGMVQPNRRHTPPPSQAVDFMRPVPLPDSFAVMVELQELRYGPGQKRERVDEPMKG